MYNECTVYREVYRGFPRGPQQEPWSMYLEEGEEGEELKDSCARWPMISSYTQV